MTDRATVPSENAGLERHTFDALKMAAGVGLFSWVWWVLYPVLFTPIDFTLGIALVSLGVGGEAAVAALLAWYAVVYLVPKLSFTSRVTAFFPVCVVTLGIVSAVTALAFTMDWSDPLDVLNRMALGIMYMLGMKMPGLILGTAAGVWWLHRSRRKR